MTASHRHNKRFTHKPRGKRATEEIKLIRICAWCDKRMGVKPGKGVTHGIYEACAKRFVKHS